MKNIVNQHFLKTLFILLFYLGIDAFEEEATLQVDGLCGDLGLVRGEPIIGW